MTVKPFARNRAFPVENQSVPKTAGSCGKKVRPKVATDCGEPIKGTKRTVSVRPVANSTPTLYTHQAELITD